MQLTLEKNYIAGKPVRVDDLGGQLFGGETQAHKFIVTQYAAQGSAETIAITGSVSGTLMASTGATVPLTGSLEDGKAVVVLDEDCYKVPGRFVLTIFVTSGDTTLCIYCGVGNVLRTSTDTVVYPTKSLPNLAQLVDQVQAAIDSFPADLTALQAAIAENYDDLTYPIIAGTYAWHAGTLYKAKTDISAAESWTAAHWETVHAASDLAANVSQLKSAINSLEDKTEYKQLLNGWDTVNWTIGYISSNGNVVQNVTFRNTDFIPVAEGDVIAYSLYGYNAEVYIVTGYDENQAKVTGADVVGKSGWTEGTYTVPSGVASVRISSCNNTNVKMYFRSDDVYGTAAKTLKAYVDEQDAKKVNIQQDASNAGKVLVIGNDGKLAPGDVSIDIDTTLTQEGEAADAKAVGDAIAAMESVLEKVEIKSLLDGWNTVGWKTGYINSNGGVTSNPSFRNTDFIPVSAGDEIDYNLKGYSTEVYIVTGYDSSKAKVSGANIVGSSSWTAGTYTVPSGVAFVRICSGSVTDSVLYFRSTTVNGTLIVDTQTYVDSADDALSDRIDAVEAGVEALDGFDSIKEYYTMSPNLLDPTKTKPAPSLGSGYVWTDYMPVIAGERYTLWSNGAVYILRWHNSEKSQISSAVINGKGFEKTAPENAAFATLGYIEENATKIMFAHGVVGDYVPYGVLVQNHQLPEYVARDTNNLHDPSLYVSNTSINSEGVVGNYNGSHTSDYIPVEEGHTYYCQSITNGSDVNLTGKAAYDSSFQFVETISFPYTVPEGVAYIRIAYSGGTYGAPCVRKDQSDISGMSYFNDYNTFKLINSKPTEFEQRNSLYGLKWNVMGDSITEGSGTTKTYQSFIASRTGVLPTSYGVSNTAIARRGSSYTNDMCVRYMDMTDDADIVTVFGGTNDHGNNIPIGAWGDDTVDTLYGAMKILCEGLINKYTGKKIGFITPLPKYKNDTDYSYPSASFMPYIECIKDVCKRYSIPVLDLYTESGIAPVLSSVRTAMIPDGLHPNAVGHELISFKIQRFLESL